MSTVIRIDDHLASSAEKIGRAESRSTAMQVSYWARIGKLALENPDLPVEFIQELLIAKETKDDAIPFEFLS